MFHQRALPQSKEALLKSCNKKLKDDVRSMLDNFTGEFQADLSFKRSQGHIYFHSKLSKVEEEISSSTLDNNLARAKSHAQLSVRKIILKCLFVLPTL
jgi:hypothetical protein